MTEEYKQDLLAALRAIKETQDSGRTGLAAVQLDALIAHVEQKETLK